MTKKAKVKVELDTKPAKAELRKLGKEGEKSAGRVNDSLGGGFGKSAALGAVAGAGFGLAQRMASSATGGVVSEAFAGANAWLDDRAGGPEARASKSAREQTKGAYAEIVGRMKDPSVTPDIRNYYNNVKGLREITERGNSAIEQDLGGGAIKEGIENVMETITSVGERVVAVLGLGGK
tara:strand:- start:9296 stop:9832 length:537 start_codon:yes stop_codon:yes gene_type:complete